MRTAYTYTVLRYVHDVVSGEFVNVGLILHAAGLKVVKHRIRTTIGRVRHLFPDLDKYGYAEALRAVKRGLRKQSDQSSKAGGLVLQNTDAGRIARAALPGDDSSLQWSPVGSGITDDIEKTFERLYLRHIDRYDQKGPTRRTDEDVWRPIVESLINRNVPICFEPKVIEGPADSVEFKHAWKNGSWHAYEPVSLDLAEPENIKDKARRIYGHLAAVADGASEQVSLRLLVGAPQNKDLSSAYESALKILRKVTFFDAKIIEERDFDDLVDEIEKEIQFHVNE